MADRLEMPDGSVYTVIESPADPERAPLLMEFLLQPDCPSPPPHYHPGGQSETFEVVEGAFELRRGRAWHRLEAGQSLTVEPGEIHTFRNRESRPVRVRDIHDPAHSFEPYIRRIHALVTEQGLASPSSLKAALYFSLLFREHSDTIVPAPQLRAPLALLSAVARLMRLRLPA